MSLRANNDQVLILINIMNILEKSDFIEYTGKVPRLLG